MRRSCCVAATGANYCQFQCFDRVVKCPLRSGKNGPLPGCVVPAVFQRNTVDVHIPSHLKGDDPKTDQVIKGS